jgi:hypothetical protein
VKIQEFRILGFKSVLEDSVFLSETVQLVAQSRQLLLRDEQILPRQI